MYFSDSDKELFINGFCDAAPSCYSFDADAETPFPWCAPWEWASDWYVSGLPPYEMGELFAKNNFRDIECNFSE